MLEIWACRGHGQKSAKEREGEQRKNGREAGRQTKNLLLLLLLPSLLTPEPAAGVALALVSHDICDLEGDRSSDQFEGIEP